MERVVSPKGTAERLEKWKKLGKPTTPSSSSTSSSVLKAKWQKFGSSKTTSKPGKASEDLTAMNINGLWTEDHHFLRVKSPVEKRSPRPQCPPLPPTSSGLGDIADLILKRLCRKIIVMVGAGISTASGIPDFRTPGSGMYDNLKKYNIPYPEAIFDIDYFTYNPRPFFTLAKELYPGNYKPNDVHYFLRLLHEKGVLLRCYTQNIDGLERMAGIPPEKLVEAHGTFSTASCHLCYTPFSAKVARNSIMAGHFPHCNVCYGVVKPDVVFFGEDLPKRFYSYAEDFLKADLLIVMGTSLKIEPFADIVNSVRPNVPRLLINRDLVGPFKNKPLARRDVVELGELCGVIREFVRALSWQKDMDKVIKSQRH